MRLCKPLRLVVITPLASTLWTLILAHKNNSITNWSLVGKDEKDVRVTGMEHIKKPSGR